MAQQQTLVTIDLENATDKQRDDFNKKLKELKWIKIDNVSTAWKTYFDENTERKKIIMILQNGIKVAKDFGKIKKVNYALQNGKENIIAGDI